MNGGKCIRFMKCLVFVCMLLMTSTKVAGIGLNDTLSLCANDAFPPYEYVDSKGQPSGFDIDIVCEIMDRIHHPYKLVMARWDKAQQMYMTGKVNVLTGVFRHEGLVKKYNFGLGYASLYHCVVFRRGEQEYSNIQSLKGKKVLLEVGDGMYKLLKDNGLDKEIVYVKNMVVGLRMLSDGKADAAICAKEMADYTTKTFDISNLDKNGLDMLPEEFCFACKDTVTLARMDGALLQMRQDGTYQKIYDKWFNNTSDKILVRVVLIILGVLLIISLVSFFFVYILRRKVAQAEEKLLSQNKQLRQVNEKLKFGIRATDTAFWEIDADTYSFISYNERLLDGSREYGHHRMREIMDIVHPDDLDLLKKMDSELSKRTLATYDVRMKSTIDQQWHHNNITVAPFEWSHDGKVLKYIAFRKDTSRYVQLNNQLQHYALRFDYTFQSSGIKFWEFDVKNEIFKIYSKMNQLEEVISRREFMARLSQEDRVAVLQIHENMRTGRQNSFRIQLKMDSFAGDEHVHYLLFSGIHEFGESDEAVTSYFGLAQDVTQFIETQNRMLEEKEKAQISDKLKTAFLHNISHEIRTPLNAIVGFSQLLQKSDNDDEKKLFIDLINTNTDNLLVLVNEIVDLSNIQSGDEIRHVEYDLADDFNKVMADLSRQCVSPEVQFIQDNPYQKCILMGDKLKVNMLLTHLTKNAIRFTKSGHVKVGYRCADNTLTITVEDTGIGIAEENFESIFDRFVKVDSFSQGVGLGLSICKAITDRYHGTIHIQSQLGHGSIFTVTVPTEIKVIES